MPSNINAGSAFVEITLQDKLTAGLLAAKTKLQAFGAVAITTSKVLGGLSAAILTPLTAAVGGLVAGGKLDRVLKLFGQLNETLTEVATELADAILPVLDTSVGIVNGLAIATSNWLKSNSAIVKVVAQIGAYLGGAAGAVAAIGVAANQLGSGFGFLAQVVPVVTTFLASPLGLTLAIGAAVVAAAAAWIKFTASGQAAGKFLLDTFGPAIEFIKTTVGGIADALSAGNIQLAGRIAATALKLVFVEAVSAITEILGESLGGFFATQAKALITGDLVGYWDNAMTAMAAAWDALAAGMVVAFRSAIQVIAGLWADMTRRFDITLIGFQEIARRFGQGGLANVIGQARSGLSIAGTIGSTALSITDTGAAVVEERLRARQAASGADFAKRFGGGNAALQAEVASLRAQLAGLRGQAAKEAAAARTGGPTLPTAEQASAVAVGFSGAALALQLQGGGQTVQGRIAKATEDTKKNTGTMAGLMQTIADRFKVFVVSA